MQRRDFIKLGGAATALGAAGASSTLLADSAAASSEIFNAGNVSVSKDRGDVTEVTADPEFSLEWSNFDDAVGAIFLGLEARIGDGEYLPVYRSTPWLVSDDLEGTNRSKPSTTGSYELTAPLSKVLEQSRRARENDNPSDSHPLFGTEKRPITLLDERGPASYDALPYFSYRNEEEQSNGTDVAETGAMVVFQNDLGGGSYHFRAVIDSSKINEVEPNSDPLGGFAFLFDKDGEGDTYDFQAGVNGSADSVFYKNPLDSVDESEVPITITNVVDDSDVAVVDAVVDDLEPGFSFAVNNSRGGESVNMWISNSPEGAFAPEIGFDSNERFLQNGNRAGLPGSDFEQAFAQWQIGNSIDDFPNELLRLANYTEDPEDSPFALRNHFPGAESGSYSAGGFAPENEDDNTTQDFTVSIRYNIEFLRLSLGQVLYAISQSEKSIPIGFDDVVGQTPQTIRALFDQYDVFDRVSVLSEAEPDDVNIVTGPDNTVRSFDVYQHTVSMDGEDGYPTVATTVENDIVGSVDLPATTRAFPAIQQASEHPGVIVSESDFTVSVTNEAAKPQGDGGPETTGGSSNTGAS